MQNRTEQWGAYGRLALGWANAFLKEEDCLVLRIILSHGKLKLDVDTQVYQEAQLYMTKQCMMESLTNLNNSCIIKTQSARGNYQHMFHQTVPNNITECSINEDIQSHLKLFLDHAIKSQFNDLHARTRDVQEKVQCCLCAAEYKTLEAHLHGLRVCRRCNKDNAILIPKQHDQQLETDVRGLEKIIKHIEECLRQCDDEPFPYEQVTQIDVPPEIKEKTREKSVWEKLGETEEGRRARKIIVDQRRKLFNQPNRIQEFLDQKRKLLKLNRGEGKQTS